MLHELIEPLLVLLVIFLIASPFSLSIHKLISFMRANVGNSTALAVYALEIAVLLAWNTSYMKDLDANIALGRYDGPVGFERGIVGGFLIIFAAMLVLQNCIGLIVLYRKTLRRAMIALIWGTWRVQMNQFINKVTHYLHRSLMGWS